MGERRAGQGSHLALYRGAVAWMKRDDAEKIIAYRNQQGYLEGLDAISQIEGVSPGSIAKLKESAYDEEYVQLSRSQLEELMSGKGLAGTLITGSLHHLAIRAAAWFMFYAILAYFLFIRQLPTKKQAAISLAAKAASLVLYLPLALFCVIAHLPAIVFTAVAAVMVLLQYVLFTRKKHRIVRREFVFGSTYFIVVFTYSLL